MSELDITRIEHLTGTRAAQSQVAVIGLGSGGFPVLQHLAMSGWSRFALVDPDSLDEPNLVKHPGLRSSLGRPKVDIATEWLMDRNPKARVQTLQDDVTALAGESLSNLIEASDLVVSATDSNAVRHYINDGCIQARTPMTVGLVHRGGVGGTVFAYRPDESGCYACLELVAEGLDALPTDDELPTTRDEQEMIYGRGIRGYSAAGLSADIAAVAAMHAQITIGELSHLELRPDSMIRRSDANWVSIRFRAQQHWTWQVNELGLPAVEGCNSCG